MPVELHSTERALAVFKFLVFEKTNCLIKLNFYVYYKRLPSYKRSLKRKGRVF